MFLKYKDYEAVNSNEVYLLSAWEVDGMYKICFYLNLGESHQWQFDTEAERDYVLDFIIDKLGIKIPDFKAKKKDKKKQYVGGYQPTSGNETDR